MLQLQQLVAVQGGHHSVWWLVLAVVLVATTVPLVILVGRGGIRGDRPLRR
jgi:hypothetical protein